MSRERRRRRVPTADYDAELHYGEANRRRAREFLGLRANPEGAPDPEPPHDEDAGGGRGDAAADDPGQRRVDDAGRWWDDDVTGQHPPADVFGMTAESPGLAGQPTAPWMTGEHRAIAAQAPPPPTTAPGPPPTGVPPPPGAGWPESVEPAPGPSVFADPAPVPDLDDEPAGTAVPPGLAEPPGVPPPPAVPQPPPVGDVPPPPGAPPPPVGEAAPAAEAPPSSARGSYLVAAGIFLSRTAGLAREMVMAGLLATGPAAEAFKAAIRIPNLLQNLLGEGVLSASFIPVYARLRAEGRDDEAGRLAGAIAGLLAAVTGLISVLGILFAAPLTRVLVPGYAEDTYELTVQLTRIMFPGIGFLVLSAWCLGVLNSHKRFFLSYVAPVLWNVAQIAALVVTVLILGGFRSPSEQRDLAVALSWGVLVGGILQFGVQLRPVTRLLGGVRLSLDTGNVWVRNVIGRFVPVLVGRGAIQIMGWVDLMLASWLAAGAVPTLTYTLVLYLLPISLFGMSVAAAELPDMSETTVHDPDTRRRFRLRLEHAMARIAWYVAFTATVFIVVGDVVVAAVFEWGNFTHADTVAVWLTLAVMSVALLPATSSRLLQNGLYALDDPRTPARLGVLSVVLAAVIGALFMFPLDHLFVGPSGIEGWSDMAFRRLPTAVREDPSRVHLGIVGLALGTAISRWIEYRLLSTALAWRIGRTKMAGRWLGPIAAGCGVAATVAFVAEMVAGPLPAIPEAMVVVGLAGLAYLGVTRALAVPEAVATADRLAGLARRLRS